MTEKLSELMKSNTQLFSLVETTPLKPARLQHVVSMNLAKTWDETEEPCVTGLDFLPDGRIVVVDIRNRKCFTMTGTLKRLGRWYKFKTQPKDVTSYKDNCIAVTVGSDTLSNVCLLNVSSDNTITLMKVLKVSVSCWSIAQIKADTFVVSTWNNSQPVRIIDADGKESDFENVIFPTKMFKFGTNKCTYNSYQDTLVLIDQITHTVNIYNTVTGERIAVTDGLISEPIGACIGPCGSVFVCSQFKHSIVQISSTGCVIASCDVNTSYPMTVAISKDGSRLAVSNNVKGVRKIKLFEITS